METLQISVQKRTELGKNRAKQSRKEGLVPAVIYGEHSDPIHVSMNAREANKLFRTSSNKNTMITLQIQDENGTKDVTVLSKKVDKDAITQLIIHMDFVQVDPAHPIKTEVSIRFVGNAPGVKKGGNIFYNIRKIKIQCLPHSIPASIDLDLNSLEVGESLRIKDLPKGEYTILSAEDEIIVYVESGKGKNTDEETAAGA